MKKVISMFTAFLMVLCMAFPVFSAEKRDKTVLLFEDGSYLVIMLEADPQTRAAAPTASKSYTYYNSNDERQWIFMLRASFMYDGTNSEAISAEAAYTIVNRDWVLTDSDAYCQGAAAIGEAVFEHSTMGAVPVTVTIRCDKNGNIT